MTRPLLPWKRGKRPTGDWYERCFANGHEYEISHWRHSQRPYALHVKDAHSNDYVFCGAANSELLARDIMHAIARRFVLEEGKQP